MELSLSVWASRCPALRRPGYPPWWTDGRWCVGSASSCPAPESYRQPPGSDPQDTQGQDVKMWRINQVNALEYWVFHIQKLQKSQRQKNILVMKQNLINKTKKLIMMIIEDSGIRSRKWKDVDRGQARQKELWPLGGAVVQVAPSYHGSELKAYIRTLIHFWPACIQYFPISSHLHTSPICFLRLPTCVIDVMLKAKRFRL